ncbi:hypothetical protein AeMF1_004374 [Aphanomyces euteiches]|nr:hypothetical protein AeMF1_004374 [Aphanomyces euteiches]KAH9184097.1 hypothetical protein AeNC1_013929 [Aphanomyces euteiches]
MTDEVKKQTKREKLLASKRAWAKEHYENNREKILEINRNWAKKNRDKIRETKRRYRERNREKHKRQTKTYYRNWKRRRQDRGEDEDGVDSPQVELEDNQRDADGEGDDNMTSRIPVRQTPRQRQLAVARIQKYWHRLVDMLPPDAENMRRSHIDDSQMDSTGPSSSEDESAMSQDEVSDVSSKDESMYTRAPEAMIIRQRKPSIQEEESADDDQAQLERLKAMQDPSMAAVLETIFFMRRSQTSWHESA